MAITTFAPAVPPSPGSDIKTTVKKLQAEFGDGYSQAVPDGINSIRRELSLNWDMLTPDQSAVIIAFFEARGGCEPFYYTPSDDASPKKWTCDDWREKRGDGGFRSISATFKQSFLL